MSKTLSYREFYTYIYILLFSYIIDVKLAYLRESLSGKRRFLSIDFKIYFRVNLGQKQYI
jgi:hypothetical protein